MIELVSKNSDFSGAGLEWYVPPVSGATVCAFVGDQDIGVSLRNFGSGADLLPTGESEPSGDGFRTFGPGVYLTTDEYRRYETTLMVVYRRPATGEQTFFSALTNEHNLDVGRGGMHLGRNGDEARLTLGNVTGGRGSVIIPAVAVGETSVLFGSVEGTTLRLERLNSPLDSFSKTVSLDHAPSPEESNHPFLVGFNAHRPDFNGQGKGELGFIGIWPRLLSDDEKSLMYASVQRRFASLGVTI